MLKRLVFVAVGLFTAAPAHAQFQKVTGKGITATSWATKEKACYYSYGYAAEKATKTCKQRGLRVLMHSRKNGSCTQCTTTRNGQFKCTAESSVQCFRLTSSVLSGAGEDRRSVSQAGACRSAQAAALRELRQRCKGLSYGTVKKKIKGACTCAPLDGAYLCYSNSTITCDHLAGKGYLPTSRYQLKSVLRSRLKCRARVVVKSALRRRPPGMHTMPYRITITVGETDRAFVTKPNSPIDVDGIAKSACANIPPGSTISGWKAKAQKKLEKMRREFCAKAENKTDKFCLGGRANSKGGTGIRG